MKRQLIILLCICGILPLKAQQIIELCSGEFITETTSTTPTREIEELADGYIVTYNFKNALIQPDKLYSGTIFWKIDGFGMNSTPADPCTLVRSDMIAIPLGYNAKVELLDSVYCDFNYELTPARQPMVDSNNEEYTLQNVLAIKPYDGFKPKTVVSQSETLSYRGHNMCHITLSPIQYNYNTRTIRAYTSLTYKVSFIPDNSVAVINRTAQKNLSYEDNFVVNNVIDGNLKNINMQEAKSVAQSDVQDYLILTTDKYSVAANRFAEWKRLLGFNVHVIVRNDWTSTSVKSTVSDAYVNLPALYYLLIVGDHDDVPAQQSSLKNTHVTDFFYGCMDDDYIPDIYCGRLSVSSSDEAINVVEKIIGYEQTPPAKESFYNNGVHCAYFQDNNNDGYADRRFAQTSEDVRTYVMSQYKSIERIYKTGTSVNPQYWNNTYFSEGEAIPEELLKNNGFEWNGNSTNINNAINDGVFYVLHRDHGAVWGWGDPLYMQTHILRLSNDNLLPIVFSMNCLTGKFDENCFAETFIRKSDGGCVAIYGATEVSYSGYNDVLTTGMFDAIWPDPGLSIKIPNQNNSFSATPTPTYALGQILAQGMVRLAETYGYNNSYTKYTNEIFHCFGDPSMKIYTENPTAFTDVSIVRNVSSISVNLGANDIARITMYDPISGDVQSSVGNSATVTTLNPSETIVCVSAHNRIPFIQKQDVMYIQNTNIVGNLNETHDVVKVGNHVNPAITTGDVTTSGANITLKAKEVLLDSGTYISVGSTLKTITP